MSEPTFEEAMSELKFNANASADQEATKEINTSKPVANASVAAPANDKHDAEPTMDEVLASMGTTPSEAPAAQTKATDKEDVPQIKSYEQYVENVVKLKKKLLNEQKKQKEEFAKHQELIEQGKKFQELMNLKDSDPLAFIDAVKLEPDAVVQRMVKEAEAQLALSPKEQEAKLLEKVNKEVEARLEAEEKRRQKEAQDRHNELFIQQAVAQYRNAISETISSNDTKYELIKLFGQEDRVWNETVRYYEKFGQAPAPEIVCDAVEQLLRNDAEKFMSTKLFQQLTGKTLANNSNGTSNNPITLTNNTAKASAEIIQDDLDEKQAFQEALKLIKIKE